jgi:phosphopantetheine adenylyltransferase
MSSSNSSLPSLLILPSPPNPVSRSTLKVAYEAPLTSALSDLASQSLSSPAILEIVLPCPSFHARLEIPRSQIFKEAEHLVAGIYGLVAAICAQKSIEVDGSGSVDARVILTAYDPTQLPLNDPSPLPKIICGPVIDFHTFALTRREWQWIFTVDGERGEDIFNKYICIANGISPIYTLRGQVRKVTGGISMVSKQHEALHEWNGGAKRHRVVAVGGTFDHLHAGHKLLLTATALMLQPAAQDEIMSRRLIVGITGDELLKNKKYADQLESWSQRQGNVVDFLLSILSFTPPGKSSQIETISYDEPVVNGRAIHTQLSQASLTIECVEIQDPFGPTITDETVSALVVSGETRDGGAAVNTKRAEKGWKSLEMFEVDVLDAEEDEPSVNKSDNFASKISSTAIRKRRAEVAHRPSL